MSLVQPTRILVVGSGAREHALAWKLANDPGVNEVAVAPGSDGIAAEARVRRLAGVDPLDPASVEDAARARAAELVVVGPEAPLAAGVADRLTQAGIPVFGPTAAAARIEVSKRFCREVAAAAGVPTAAGRSFGPSERIAALAYARELAASGRGGVVIKADGLAGGKGVVVCGGPDEAEDALAALAGAVVVEERLVGREASVIALCDGTEALALPIARDHKRLADGDRGPNTGGMGAYSPLPDLPDEAAEEIVERVHRPVLAELARRGTPFRGALYAGLMLTADGPRLLEFNARLGDPETQVLLPRLGVALGPLLLAAARGELADAGRALGLRGRRLPVVPGAAVAIVLAAPGYPGAPRTGGAITGLDADGSGALVFHAATARDPDGTWRTAGGRVLSVVGQGADVAGARTVAEAGAGAISFAGLQRRGDIGLDAVPAGAAR